MRDFIRAIRYGSKFKLILAFLIMTAFIISSLNAATPLILKKLFDFIDYQLKSGSTSISLWEPGKFILIFLLVEFCGTIFNSLNNLLASQWWTKTWNKLSGDALRHAEGLTLKYYEETGTGKLLERINQGVNDTVSITANFFSTILPQIFFLIIALYFLFKTGAVYGFIVLFGVPLYGLIILVYANRIHSLQKEVRRASEKSRNISYETVANIKTVKTFAREEKHYNEYQSKLALVLRKNFERQIVRLKMMITRGTVVDICRASVLLFGTYQTLTGKITLGSLILVWSFTGQAFGPISYIVNQIDDIIRDLVSVKLLNEFFQTKPEISDAKNAKDLKNVKGEIILENLTFRYKGDRQNVVENLNIGIENGEILALVGKSGVGKSTLVKLLLRFYEPTKGCIKIDGVDIKKITQKSLRENIGVVMQDSIIFNDTVTNNIKYGNPKASEKEVIRAAKLANAHDFIENLPKKYNTVVGERGVKLSGGEQQRINIARVILKNPSIVILDEATSSLDSESEKLIQEALWKLIEGKTAIIIAHRLSTVMQADLIAVLDGGKIVEIDNHRNLVKKKGIYANLFKIQSGGYLK